MGQNKRAIIQKRGAKVHKLEERNTALSLARVGRDYTTCLGSTTPTQATSGLAYTTSHWERRAKDFLVC